MLTNLAEIETKYLKKDKSIPTELSLSIKKILMNRLSIPLRFNSFLSKIDNRFVDSANPVCSEIEYTPYEQAMYNLCNKFNIVVTYKVKDLTEERRKCLLNITVDIQQKNLSCELLSGLSIVQTIKKICSPEYKIVISDTECKRYYNELTQQKSCSYSYDQYKNLLSLGFLPKVVEYAVKNNSYISPDGKYLTTSNSNYSLQNDLCFNNITTTGIDNAKDFLTSAITDLPDSLKEQILQSYDL